MRQASRTIALDGKRIARFIAAFVLFAGALFFQIQAHASEKTGGWKPVPRNGQDMLDNFAYCAAHKGTPCYAYPISVITGSIVTSKLQQQPYFVCLPEKMKQDELTGAIKAYIEKNPETKKVFAPFIVIAALHEKFPCAAADAPDKTPSTPKADKK